MSIENTARSETGGTTTDITQCYYGTYVGLFNASKSNPIYGNSSTVQPPAIQLIPQIKY